MTTTRIDERTTQTIESQEYFGHTMLTIWNFHNYPAGMVTIKRYQVILKDGTKSKVYSRRGDASRYLVNHL